MPNQNKVMMINRSALFYWLVFGISFSMSFIFPSLKDFAGSFSFSWWMLVALLLYTAGALLKHRPLSYRMSRSGDSSEMVPYVIFLFAGHMVIVLMLLVFSAPAVTVIFNISAVHEKDPVSSIIVLADIILAVLISWLVFRTKAYKQIKRNFSTPYLFRRELVADILLVKKHNRS